MSCTPDNLPRTCANCTSAVGENRHLARVLFGVGPRPVSGEFQIPSLSRKWHDQGCEKKRAKTSKREVSFCRTNGHRKHDAACPKKTPDLCLFTQLPYRQSRRAQEVPKAPDAWLS